LAREESREINGPAKALASSEEIDRDKQEVVSVEVS